MAVARDTRRGRERRSRPRSCRRCSRCPSAHLKSRCQPPPPVCAVIVLGSGPCLACSSRTDPVPPWRGSTSSPHMPAVGPQASPMPRGPCRGAHSASTALTDAMRVRPAARYGMLPGAVGAAALTAPANDRVEWEHGPAALRVGERAASGRWSRAVAVIATPGRLHRRHGRRVDPRRRAKSDGPARDEHRLTRRDRRSRPRVVDRDLRAIGARAGSGALDGRRARTARASRASSFRRATHAAFSGVGFCSASSAAYFADSAASPSSCASSSASRSTGPGAAAGAATRRCGHWAASWSW